MVGIDLFDNKRRDVFSKKIIERFFLKDEVNLILSTTFPEITASKFWCVKEAVYKLLHNLYPNLYFNKLSINVKYTNYVFKVSYIKQNDLKINEVVDQLNWDNIYISDSDEKDTLCVVAILK